MNQIACPTLDKFQAMFEGNLSPDAVESLAQHVETCPTCAGTIATLGHDTLTDALRSGAEAAKESDEAALQKLLERAQASVTPPSDTTEDSSNNGRRSLVANPNDTLALLGKPQTAGEIGRLGVYRILRQMGQGGMGIVFEAEDTKLERRVALKMMKPEIAKNDRQRDRKSTRLNSSHRH